jgi:hypothetical protein
VENPNSVKIDQQVEERSLFEISFEKDLGPVDTVKLHESLGGWNIDQSSLVGQDDSADTLGVPEKLVDIVVTDSLVVVLLPSQELAVDNFVTLISQELVQWLDNGSEVKTFGNGILSVLAFGRSVIVVGALEDEAQTFRHESDLGSLTPTEQVKGDLSKSVILRHVVHGRPPSSGCGIVRLLLGSGSLGLDVLLSSPGDRADSSETGVVHGSDSIVKIELGGKVPFSVVGVFTSNVVCVEGEKSLVGRHSRCSRVELDHEKVVDISGRVLLETEFIGKVDENILDLLLGERDVGLGRPCGLDISEAS